MVVVRPYFFVSAAKGTTGIASCRCFNIDPGDIFETEHNREIFVVIVGWYLEVWFSEPERLPAGKKNILNVLQFAEQQSIFGP